MEFLAPFFTLLVSVAYFKASSPGTSTGRRLFVSAHGAVGTLLFVLAMIIGSSGHAKAQYGTPYLCLFILPFALIGFALIFFRGNTKVHILQFPNVLALFYSAFVGGMVTTGSFL